MTVQCNETYNEGLMMFTIITYVCHIHKVCVHIYTNTYTHTQKLKWQLYYYVFMCVYLKFQYWLKQSGILQFYCNSQEVHRLRILSLCLLYLSYSFGRRISLIGGTLLYLVGGVATLVTSGFIMLLVSRFVIGMGQLFTSYLALILGMFLHDLHDNN
jgi:hypothetical protein